MEVLPNPFRGTGLPPTAGVAEGRVRADPSGVLALLDRCPVAAPTPLLPMPALAAELGVDRPGVPAAADALATALDGVVFACAAAMSALLRARWGDLPTIVVAETVDLLAHHGVSTTPSGAAGVAGLQHAGAHRTTLGLHPGSRVLEILTEGPEGRGGGRPTARGRSGRHDGRRRVRRRRHGLFARFPMDAVFGLHNLPGLPVGHLATGAGTFTAFEELFTIDVRGSGGHASAPERNTIPSRVTIRGDVRGYDDRVGATNPAPSSSTTGPGVSSCSATAPRVPAGCRCTTPLRLQRRGDPVRGLVLVPPRARAPGTVTGVPDASRVRR